MGVACVVIGFFVNDMVSHVYRCSWFVFNSGDIFYPCCSCYDECIALGVFYRSAMVNVSVQWAM